MYVITGKTKLLGVIGDPVTHSLSPVIHNAALRALGLDYVYLPLPVKSTDLQVALAGFTAIGLVGFNVTIPHKQAIIPLLQEVSPIAQAVGAVNTVWRTESGWSGTNTDVTGFLAPLQTDPRDWSQTIALILGNGGAARAVVAGLVQLNCGEIHLIGRNLDHLVIFQHSWLNSPQKIYLHIHLWEKLPELISQSLLIVNTTPIGMYPQIDDSPISRTIIGKITPGAIVYDLIYRPSPTQFLQLASAQGAIAIDGKEMLVQQGATALQMWLNQPVPIDIMRQALQEQLNRS